MSMVPVFVLCLMGILSITYQDGDIKKLSNSLEQSCEKKAYNPLLGHKISDESENKKKYIPTGYVQHKDEMLHNFEDATHDLKQIIHPRRRCMCDKLCFEVKESSHVCPPTCRCENCHHFDSTITKLNTIRRSTTERVKVEDLCSKKTLLFKMQSDLSDIQELLLLDNDKFMGEIAFEVQRDLLYVLTVLEPKCRGGQSTHPEDLNELEEDEMLSTILKQLPFIQHWISYIRESHNTRSRIMNTGDKKDQSRTLNTFFIKGDHKRVGKRSLTARGHRGFPPMKNFDSVQKMLRMQEPLAGNHEHSLTNIPNSQLAKRFYNHHYFGNQRKRHGHKHVAEMKHKQYRNVKDAVLHKRSPFNMEGYYEIVRKTAMKYIEMADEMLRNKDVHHKRSTNDHAMQSVTGHKYIQGHLNYDDDVHQGDNFHLNALHADGFVDDTNEIISATKSGETDNDHDDDFHHVDSQLLAYVPKNYLSAKGAEVGGAEGVEPNYLQHISNKNFHLEENSIPILESENNQIVKRDVHNIYHKHHVMMKDNKKARIFKESSHRAPLEVADMHGDNAYDIKHRHDFATRNLKKHKELADQMLYSKKYTSHADQTSRTYSHAEDGATGLSIRTMHDPPEICLPRKNIVRKDFGSQQSALAIENLDSFEDEKGMLDDEVKNHKSSINSESNGDILTPTVIKYIKQAEKIIKCKEEMPKKHSINTNVLPLKKSNVKDNEKPNDVLRLNSLRVYAASPKLLKMFKVITDQQHMQVWEKYDDNEIIDKSSNTEDNLISEPSKAMNSEDIINGRMVIDFSEEGGKTRDIINERESGEDLGHDSDQYFKRCGPWSDWTVCSVTCGFGRVLRHRMCKLNHDDENILIEIHEKACIFPSCKR